MNSLQRNFNCFQINYNVRPVGSSTSNNQVELRSEAVLGVVVGGGAIAGAAAGGTIAGAGGIVIGAAVGAVGAIAGAAVGAIRGTAERAVGESRHNTHIDQQSKTIFEQLQLENIKIQAIHNTLNILDKKESYMDPISHDEIKFDTEKNKWILNLGNEIKEIEKGSWIAYSTQNGNVHCKVVMPTISLIKLMMNYSESKCPLTRKTIPNEILEKIGLNREKVTAIPTLTADL